MTTIQLAAYRGVSNPRRLLLIVLGTVVVAAAIGLGGWQLWRYQQYQRQLAATQAAPVADIASMDIREFAFAAAHIQVRAGETVTWSNADEAEHDITFRSGAVESGTLATGGTWSHTFAEPGVYDYYCGAHPFMVGRVTVSQ